MLQCATIRLLQEAVRVDTAVVVLVASGVSGGIYGVSGISMDIPEISMFHKQVTLCHQSGDIL